MTSPMSSIRQAISAEIKRLEAELSKLQTILVQLGDDGVVPRPRGRPLKSGIVKRKYTRRAQPN
ncbi:MAG TPA: hypothetical protein VF595_02480, partial [Tepidisphaeraceae bacterium]